jgi:hypothetical protein
MPAIRITAAGAAILFFSGLTIIGAAAQGAAGGKSAPGKPLQLLKIFQQSSSSTKAKPHAKVAAKPSSKKAVRTAAARKAHSHVAAAKRGRPLALQQTASAAPRESSRPAANSPVPADVAFAPPATQPSLPMPAAQVESAPSQTSTSQLPGRVVVAGQTVQVAAPDAVNEMDLAANNTSAQANDAAPSMMASAPALREIADATPKSDAKSDFVSAAPPPQQSSDTIRNDMGSPSWILQVLAALGGAVTAGSVAWFLIGSTPQRTYG